MAQRQRCGADFRTLLQATSSSQLLARFAAQVSGDNAATLLSDGSIIEARTPLTYASQGARRYAFFNRRTK